MRHRAFWNALFSAVQVVVNAIAMIVLYRVVYVWLGSAVGGVWGVVLAWTSAAGIASFGLAGGVTKYVAQYAARGEDTQAARFVETATLTVGVILIPVLVAAYWPLRGVLGLVYSSDLMLENAARSILPYALGSFWLASVALTLLSGIDGVQRVAVRNVLVMVASVALLGLAWLRVPSHGLVGLAQAQLGQNALLLVGAWGSAHRLLPEMRLLRLRWRWQDLRTLLGYGLGTQAIAISQMLFEPITKGFMAAINPGAVFFFDMAHKLVAQSRAVIATAHAALVPTLAAWHEQHPSRLRGVYVLSCRAMLLVVAVGLPVLIGAAPIISTLWLGDYEPLFVSFLCILAVGWMLNLMANPAYFDNLSTGALRPNVVGHALIGVLNAGLAWVLGHAFGALGVAVAFVVALLAGSGFIQWSYERASGLTPAAWLERRTLRLLLLNCFGASVLWFAWSSARAPITLAGVGGLWAAGLAILVLKHPLLRQARASLFPSANTP